MEGLDIPLTSTEGVLTQELQKLEEMVLGKMDVCFQHGMCSIGGQGLDQLMSYVLMNPKGYSIYCHALH